MKICILTTVDSPFDPRVFYKEAKSLAKVHDVIVIAPSDEPIDKEIDGIRVITVRKLTNKILHPITMWKIFREGLKQECDVCHCHAPGGLFLGALLKISKRSKVMYDAREHYPSLIAENSLFPDFIRPLVRFLADIEERVLIRFADVVITVNESLQKHYAKIGKEAIVIYNFPNLKAFNPDKKNGILGKEYAQNKIVIYEGAVSRKRGLDKFLLALPKVRETVLDVKFLVVGKLFDTGDFEKWIDDYLKKQKLNANFEMIGQKPHEEVVNYINISNVGIILFQPTHYNNLIGLPLKLFEYMACGKPVVATKTAGFEILEKYNAGLLVNPENPEEFSNAIIKLLLNRKLGEQMGANGRELVVREYSWESAAKKTIEVFRTLLE